MKNGPSRESAIHPRDLLAIGAIGSQEEHHRSRSFPEEYREFLQKHGVPYDERYVWD
jgi:hypothetical protein